MRRRERESIPNKSLYRRWSLWRYESFPPGVNAGGNTISLELAISLSKAFGPNRDMPLEAASTDSEMKTQTLAQANWLQRLTSASVGTVWGSINFSSLNFHNLYYIVVYFNCFIQQILELFQQAAIIVLPAAFHDDSCFDHTLALLHQDTEPCIGSHSHDRQVLKALTATGGDGEELVILSDCLNHLDHQVVVQKCSSTVCTHY